MDDKDAKIADRRCSVKERPILFSGPMVRAILDDRKTQTRRVVHPQPSWRTKGPRHRLGDVYPWSWRLVAREEEIRAYRSFACPYGRPGDRLWVRESFRLPGPIDNGIGGFDRMSPQDAAVACFGIPTRWYEADGANLNSGAGFIGEPGRLRPSIHMPRWASRLTLEVTSVRVERLQELTLADVNAEGVGSTTFIDARNARGHFARGWDSLNAKRGHGWDTNPWVWVVKFKRIAS